jgi:spermidine/putrescine transport system ATP-binding protein
MSPGAEPMVEVRGVTKEFGKVAVVSEVSLSIRSGELITLLGPSGCGKTTLLRMISGLETPTRGRILLAGQDVTHLPPYRRDVNQVFQSYALFPHLSVKENIRFGLRMKKVARREADERVREVLEMVSLGGLEERKPGQLSGGQRQRVALARALVCRPKVLLLDEPLSALDAKLRRAMQVELKQLQQQLGITFIFVTHDQEEALALSDRIAVIHEGRVEQLGDASEIYHRPRTPFVASFIGHANILEVDVVAREGARATVRLSAGLELTVLADGLSAAARRALISVRPEKILIRKERQGTTNGFEAEVAQEIFMGAMDQLLLRTASGLELWAVVANESAGEDAVHKGDRVFCHLHLDDIVVIQEA